MIIGAALARQRTDVVVYRNLSPVKDLSTLAPNSQQALAAFRAAMNIAPEVDLSGEWWGVIVFEPRRFQCCDSQAEAEAVGLALGRELGSAVWLEADGHPSAKLLESFR